jgi:hypothetical protein
MKITLVSFLLLFTTNTLFSQSIILPYYTGFDSPSEQVGWQQFRTGFISNFDWGNNGAIGHDYNVGGNSTDTVIDWYVSPPLNFTSVGMMTMKVKTGGFSIPTLDNCEVWFGTNDPNPSTGNFVLIGNLSDMQPQYQWLDTTINIPFISDSGYVAFKYKTIGAAWMTYTIDSITISSTTVGIDKVVPFNKLRANIIPNPLISIATIYFEYEIRNGQLNLYNISGRKVRTITNIIGQEYTLDRKNLPAGTYIFSLLQDNTVITSGELIISD